MIVSLDYSTLRVVSWFSFGLGSENHIYKHLMLNHENIILSSTKLAIYPITPGQCRAARALLDITQPDLAGLAGLGLSTVVDFEKSRRDVSRDAVVTIAKALQEAGVTFIAKNGGGPGVRLRS